MFCQTGTAYSKTGRIVLRYILKMLGWLTLAVRLNVNSLSRHLPAFSPKVLISSILVVGKWETQRNLEEGYVLHIS